MNVSLEDDTSYGAGWSSPVARQAHNLKVRGSNPLPATKLLNHNKWLEPDKNTCVWPVQKRVNAESTFDESP